MTSTRQSTVLAPRSTAMATPSTPMKKHNPTPPTPSTLYKNDFDLSPDAALSYSFNDSGFFSQHDTFSPGTDYNDFQLFDENEGVDLESSYDSARFFADADAITNTNLAHALTHNQAAAWPQPQTTTFAPTHISAISPAPNSDLLNTVRHNLENYYIHTPPTSPEPKKLSYMADGNSPAYGSYSPPLQEWHAAEHRHEKIAYSFEQPPYVVRGMASAPPKSPKQRERKSRKSGVSKSKSEPRKN